MIPKLVFDVANVVIFAAILYGVALRRRRELHAKVMRGCFVADLLMVLVIEIQRGAVMQTVEQAQTLSKGLLSFHIFVSVSAMVLWVFQLVVGAKLLKGAPLLPRHRALAVGFLLCRLTNVATAFFV